MAERREEILRHDGIKYYKITTEGGEVVYEAELWPEDYDPTTMKFFTENELFAFRETVLKILVDQVFGKAPERISTDFNGTVIYTCTLPPDIDEGYLRIWRGGSSMGILGPGIKPGEEEEDCNPDDKVMVLVLRIPKEEEGHG